MLMTRDLSREDLKGYFGEVSLYRLETFVDLWFSDMTQQTLQTLVRQLQKK